MNVTHITALARLQGINAYTVEGAQRKDALHGKGRTFLRQLAVALGLPKGSYDIRSNKGGIAVSGEVTLHHERLYVQLLESCIGQRGVSVLYRSCKGRRDYCGGRNHHDAMRWIQGNPERFIAACQSLIANPVE